MGAPPIGDGGNHSSAERIEPPACQCKTLRHQINDRRCDVEFASEPGLDIVPVAREHIGQMIRRKGGEMGGHPRETETDRRASAPDRPIYY
jgi:hypothetical protein